MQDKKTGGISVNTEHIFPVIKKWLYSEKDIFLREIVSNATDAITKLKRLRSLGKAEDDGVPFRIDVRLDKAAKTITVEDNGIGMTREELEKDICSIALSGAVDFLQKKMKVNEGEVPQYYVEHSHPAIIEPDEWERPWLVTSWIPRKTDLPR